MSSPDFARSHPDSGRQILWRTLTVLLLILMALLSGCSTSIPEGLTPVDNFDAERYAGKWYEIARLDHRFERGLTHVTAEYTLRDDGSVGVINRGFDTNSGAWNEAKGKARFQGDERIGSLEVSFFGPFYGGYHILELDEARDDYGYSLVSGPDRSYLWILARTPSLPPQTLDQLVEQAEADGFDVQELIFVPQADPPGM